jgi:hypothetical protein
MLDDLASASESGAQPTGDGVRDHRAHQEYRR